MGEFFGILIIILYGLTISKYILRFIDKKYKDKLSKYETFYKIFSIIKKFVMKNHRILGVSSILVLLIHFIIQFSTVGFSLTGLLAAVLLISQAILGIYMVVNRKRFKTILKIHKVLASILIIAILIHII